MLVFGRKITYLLEKISNKLISFPFVQKIVIHRIEENNIENEELIKKLVINIDREYLFYDIKVKNFIDKYSKEYNLENKLKIVVNHILKMK